MAEISLVALTYRPGGIDLLGRSMTGCEGDWELVLVDDYAGRVERGVATAFLRDECDLPLTWHGPSKPKTIESRGGLANAMNTGAMRCTGSTVVFLHDYTLPPKTLAADWKASVERHGPTVMIHGVAVEHVAPRPENPGDVETWPETPRFHAIRPWVPEAFELFYVGIPMRFLEAL